MNFSESMDEYRRRAGGGRDMRPEPLPRHVPEHLASDRLCFSPLDCCDSLLMHKHITDAVTRLWIGWDTPKLQLDTSNAVFEALRGRALGDYQGWIARFSLDNQDGTDMVGLVEVVRLEEPVDGAWFELNFWVIEKLWGKGLAFEMAQTVITWLHRRTTLTRLNLSWTHGNSASAKVIARIVGDQEPIVRSAVKNGQTLPVYHYTLALNPK